MAKIKHKKGQLSIELIIILAILLGVVFLVASKMRESSTKAAATIENKSEGIYSEIEQITANQAPAPIQNSDLPLFYHTQL